MLNGPLPLKTERYRCMEAATVDNEIAAGLEISEISEWLDWMRQELSLGGVDLPGEETCVLFAASSVRLAERIRYIYKHLPDTLRSLLIQAAILHQCWTRQLKLQGKLKKITDGVRELSLGEAVNFIRRRNTDEYLTEAADGHQYIVRFPRSDRETALATELICLELARDMGLPVPSSSVILVSRKLASEVGIVVERRTRYIANGSFFSCLGLRVDIDELKIADNGRPEVRASPANFRYLTGALVFNILTLNLIQRAPVFHHRSGRAEPIFVDHSHCLMDADWSRFLKATYKEPVPLTQLAEKIKSFEQLEPWLRRARNVDFDHIWELTFKLPPVWYGGRRMVVTNVMRKLEDRARNLRHSVEYLIETGNFPNIRRHSEFKVASLES
jgi:hypothetical protein